MRAVELSADQAFIALIIAAMEADDNAAAAEAARADRLVHAMPRFRTYTRASIGRMVERMKRYVGETDNATVIGVAVRAIPSRSRASALRVVAEIVLGDERLRRAEAPFVLQVAAALGLSHAHAVKAIARARRKVLESPVRLRA
jgi:uncharacterized tellurite resistance protein B-like protein